MKNPRCRTDGSARRGHAPVPAAFVAATVEGTDAYIAVVDRGGEVSVYVCDSAGVYGWSSGPLADGAFTTATSPSGLSVTGTVTGGAVAGTVTLPDGSQHAYSANVEAAPAGLYERVDSAGQDSGIRAATIVLTDGTERGGQRRVTPDFCNGIKASFKDWAKGLVSGSSGFAEASAGASGQYQNYQRWHCENVTGSINSPVS